MRIEISHHMTHTKSPLAAASLDFYNKESVEKLWVETNYNTTEEMPTEVFFRDQDSFYELEYDALEICNGTVLDIGAGVGSHTLFLQAQGFDVMALEIDGDLVKIMRARGVENVACEDIYELKGKQYDTLLMLMNGIGLVGDLHGLEKFLRHAKTLLNHGGQILFDSSDITYLFVDDVPMPTTHYFGEIKYRYVYKKQRGEWFSWLYIDRDKLKEIAEPIGWVVQILADDGHDQYLARLTLRHLQ